MNPNIVLALSSLIDLTTRALQLQQKLQTAISEGRDITTAELDQAAADAQASIDRLKATIETMG